MLPPTPRRTQGFKASSGAGFMGPAAAIRLPYLVVDAVLLTQLVGKAHFTRSGRLARRGGSPGSRSGEGEDRRRDEEVEREADRVDRRGHERTDDHGRV